MGALRIMAACWYGVEPMNKGWIITTPYPISQLSAGKAILHKVCDLFFLSFDFPSSE